MPEDSSGSLALGDPGYRAVFLAAPDGILLVDRKGVIRDANPAAESMFGYDRDEMVGNAVEMLVPESLRTGHERYRDEFLEDPHPRPMGIGLELSGTHKDGHSIPVEISLSPLPGEEGELVIAAIRDLSVHRRLRRFGEGTLRAAEEERQKLARELHDDTAQRLASSLLRIRMAQQTEDPDDRIAILDDLRAEILKTAENVRRIARGLRPPALQDVGLATAIQSHVRGMTESSDLEIELENEAPADVLDACLDEDAMLVVYRVMQEAVSNAVRHGKADRIRVRLALSEDGERVVLEVDDDGSGFDPRRVESSDGGGLGLIGMKERASIVGGSLELTSRIGEGTRIRMKIPLDRSTPLGRSTRLDRSSGSTHTTDTEGPHG